MSPRSLSVAQARRLAIGAQGLTGTRPSVTPDRRHVRRVLKHRAAADRQRERSRASSLPAGVSRLGPYPPGLVDRMAFTHHELFEYWGHEAALLPVDLHPLMRWRMARCKNSLMSWTRLAKVRQERPGYVEWVYDEVAARGPVSAGEIAEDQKRGTEHWGWNWTDAKTVLEYLFYVGRITTGSRHNFERRYDLPERVLPPDILALPTPDEPAAQRELLMIAAKCHGVGTLGDLADYFRISNPDARPRIAELVEAGRLEPVEVRGWTQPAYALPDVIVPRRMAGRALLVPFDPLIWERVRAERYFGFRYRIEISMFPPTSGSTATTCCRSCSATRWWPGSISKRIAPNGCYG